MTGAIVEACLERAGIAAPHVMTELVGGADGTVLLLEAEDRSYVCRIWPHRPMPELVFEAELLELLARHAVPATPPYLATHPMTPGCAALRAHLPGRHPERPDDALCTAVGFQLATLHTLTRDVVPAGRVERFLLDDLGFLDEMTATASIDRAATWLRRAYRDVAWTELARSIIHDDVSLENILIDGDRVVLIDWSESHRDASVADLAAAGCQLGCTASQLERLVEAYAAHAPLNAHERALIHPAMVRRALFLLWYYAGKLAACDEPRQRERLAAHHARWTRRLEALLP